MRSLRLLTLAACVLAAAPAHTQVGERLEDERKEDFWTFFNLQPEGPARPEDGGSVLSFRPGAGDFRQMVLVTASVDDAGRIRRLELALNRELVDDPRNGIFARDAAKSFLRAALPADDVPDLAALASAIEHPEGGAGPAGYDVYLGRAARWERTLEASTVRLGNEPGPGGTTLVLAVAAR